MNTVLANNIAESINSNIEPGAVVIPSSNRTGKRWEKRGIVEQDAEGRLVLTIEGFQGLQDAGVVEEVEEIDEAIEALDEIIDAEEVEEDAEEDAEPWEADVEFAASVQAQDEQEMDEAIEALDEILEDDEEETQEKAEVVEVEAGDDEYASGLYIRAHREALGWSRKDFAENVELVYGTLSHIERGKEHLGTDRYHAIAEVLEMTAEETEKLITMVEAEKAANGTRRRRLSDCQREVRKAAKKLTDKQAAAVLKFLATLDEG